MPRWAFRSTRRHEARARRRRRIRQSSFRNFGIPLPTICPSIQPYWPDSDTTRGPMYPNDQGRRYRSASAGPTQALSQGGDTGSNPVGAANWPTPRRPSQRCKTRLSASDGPASAQPFPARPNSSASDGRRVEPP
jgi:hypothetical protein